MTIFKGITENECVNRMHPFVKGDNMWSDAVFVVRQASRTVRQTSRM